MIDGFAGFRTDAHIEIGALVKGAADIEGPSESLVHIFEDDHEPVAGVLDLPPAPSDDGLADDEVMVLQQHYVLRLAEAVTDLGRTYEIGEADGPERAGHLAGIDGIVDGAEEAGNIGFRDLDYLCGHFPMRSPMCVSHRLFPWRPCETDDDVLFRIVPIREEFDPELPSDSQISEMIAGGVLGRGTGNIVAGHVKRHPRPPHCVQWSLSTTHMRGRGPSEG